MIAARKLYLLLCAIEDHLTDAADEHRTHADYDVDGPNEAGRLLAEIEGHPDAPIPWCDATRGLLVRIRQARLSTDIERAEQDEAERVRQSDEASYERAIGRPVDYS